MSCTRYQRMAALEAGGDLPAAERPRLERHLQGCAACRSLLEELQESRRATASLASRSIAPETLARARSRALQRIDSAPSWWSMWSLTRISHQPSTAAGDAPHPASFSRLGTLDVLSSTPARPSGRKHHWARHLATLVTKPGEKCGLSLTTPRVGLAVAAGVLVAILAVWIWQGVPVLHGGRQQQATVAARTAPDVPTPQPSPGGTGAGETAAAVSVAAGPQDDPGISHPARALPTRATVEQPPVREEERVAESGPPGDSVAPQSQQVEPMIIKLVSDQEDVVIYWLVGEEPQDKESDNVV